jgi:hypothetical protein
MKTNELQRIADQIVSGYREGAWPGVSPRELLQALSPAEAAAHPIAGAHSAWEIALHIGFWHDAVRRRLGGDPVDYAPEEDWPAPAAPTEANWKAVLDDLDRGLAELAEAVRRIDPKRLSETVPGRSFDVYFMLHGVPQHDLYHAGQVVFLNKARPKR